MLEKCFLDTEIRLHRRYLDRKNFSLNKKDPIVLANEILKSVKDEMNKEDFNFYVHKDNYQLVYTNSVFKDNELVGNIKVTKLRSHEKDDLPEKYHDWLYLADLNVNKDYACKGLGTILLKEAIDFSKEVNRPILLVSVPRGHKNLNQDELNNFYIKNGFKKLDVKIPYCFGYDIKDKKL